MNFGLKPTRLIKRTTVFSTLVLFIGTVSANDRHFTYNYETAVLVPGARELEVSNTLGAGRSDYYATLDHRLEFEVGLTDLLMTAFYLNWNNTSKFDPVSGGIATAFAWKGFSSEWKLKLADPVADAVGLALYAEVGYNTDGLELEPKVILDKRMGQWLAVANLVTEIEYESTPTELELHEMEPELDLGLTYEVAKGFHAGLEFRSSSVVERPAPDESFELIISSLFLGPVVSYATESWWISFTVLPQLPALKTESGGSILDLNDHEKINARLLFSFHL